MGVLTTSSHTSRRGAGVALAVVISLMPLLIAVAETAFFYRRSLSHFLPHHSDEVQYWSMARNFAAAGLHGGHHAINEKPPSWTFSHFNVHGPGFPVLYGSIAKVVGWHDGTILWINGALIALAMYLFIRTTALTSLEAVVAGGVVCTCWPVQMYLPSSWQESLNQAIAIGLVALLAPLFDTRPRSRARIAGLVGLLLYAVFLRASWAILMVPAFLLIPARLSKSRAFWAGTLAVATALTVVAIWTRMASPGASGTNQYLHMGGLLQNLTALRAYAASNLADIFYIPIARYERVQHLQIALVVIWCLAALNAAWRAGRSTVERRQAALWTASYNLVAVVACTIVMYVVGNSGSFRVWAPHLLLSALLLLATRQPGALWLCACLVVVSLPGARPLLGTFREYHADNFAYSEAAVGDASAVFERVIHYERDLGPWCNSILSMNSPYVWAPIARLPAGIGIGGLFSWEETALPLRSRYILVNPNETRSLPTSGPIRLERQDNGVTRISFGTSGYFNGVELGTTPIGTVYQNLDAPCPRPR